MCRQHQFLAHQDFAILVPQHILLLVFSYGVVPDVPPKKAVAQSLCKERGAVFIESGLAHGDCTVFFFQLSGKETQIVQAEIQRCIRKGESASPLMMVSPRS